MIKTLVTLSLIINLIEIEGQDNNKTQYVCNETDFFVELTLSQSFHSATNSLDECFLPQCDTRTKGHSCQLPSAPCFSYRSYSNQSYCAPGILCSLLKPCHNVTYNCSSQSFTCVINTCCSPSAVCLPQQLIDLCQLEWSYSGRLHYARYGHTSSVLKNGKVLIAGGFNNDTSLKNAEIYDSSTGTFEITNSMHDARVWHTESLLENGRVFIIGGINNGIYLNTSEFYDPLTGSWTVAESMQYRRRLHTASLLLNGKILVTGGTDIYTNTTELYDPVKNKWTKTGDIHVAREYHTASVLSNGQVLIVGGTNIYLSMSSFGYNATLNDQNKNMNINRDKQASFTNSYDNYMGIDNTELYDSQTEKWTSAGSMNIGRYAHSASLLTNGKLLVVGGIHNNTVLDSAELYDPNRKTWTFTSNMHIKRYDHKASVLKNGHVIVTGGGTGSDIYYSELYNPATETWTLIGSMNDGRLWHSESVLQNGKLLVIGGYNNFVTLDTAELL